MGKKICAVTVILLIALFAFSSSTEPDSDQKERPKTEAMSDVRKEVKIEIKSEVKKEKEVEVKEEAEKEEIAKEILPSKEFLYSHGYEFVGKPVKADPRIPLLEIIENGTKESGSSFYTKTKQYTANHVAENRRGFSQIGDYDASVRPSSSKVFFEVNESPLTYVGPCTAYGYVDGVLREFKGNVIGPWEAFGDVIYTDFRIRSGVSGGILIDKDGKALGVVYGTTELKKKVYTLVVTIKE